MDFFKLDIYVVAASNTSVEIIDLLDLQKIFIRRGRELIIPRQAAYHPTSPERLFSCAKSGFGKLYIKYFINIYLVLLLSIHWLKY